MTYSDKLKDPRWQKKRLQVFDRDSFKCQCCGDTTTELHVHHELYSGQPWDAPMEALKTLCKWCHYIHEALKDECFVNEITCRKSIPDSQQIYIAFCTDKTDGIQAAYIYLVYEDAITHNSILGEAVIGLITEKFKQYSNGQTI